MSPEIKKALESYRKQIFDECIQIVMNYEIHNGVWINAVEALVKARDKRRP